MRFAKSIIFAGALLAISANLAAASPAYVISDLNLRAAPGGLVISVIPRGSPVDVQSCGGGWCSVYWAGRGGFVSQSYLNIGGPVYSPRVYPVYSPRVYEVSPPTTIYTYTQTYTYSYGPRYYYARPYGYWRRW